MIIKIPGDVQLNGNPRLENIRLNIPNNHQLRFKCNYDGNPVDIQIEDFHIKLLDKGSIAGAVIYGMDLLKKESISLNIGFHILKKSWTVTGKAGKNDIDFKFGTFPELAKLLEKII